MKAFSNLIIFLCLLLPGLTIGQEYYYDSYNRPINTSSPTPTPLPTQTPYPSFLPTQRPTATSIKLLTPTPTSTPGNDNITITTPTPVLKNTTVAPQSSGTPVLKGDTILQNNQSDSDFIKRAIGDKEEIIILPERKTGPILVGNDVPTLAATVSIDAIHDIDDFENFAENILSQDLSISRIKLASTSLELDYETPGKLFGVIPVKITAKAIMDNEYRVKVKFPWYAVFIKKAVGLKLKESESDLSKLQIAELKNELQKQAWSLQLLSSILKKHSDTASGIIQNMK